MHNYCRNQNNPRFAFMSRSSQYLQNSTNAMGSYCNDQLESGPAKILADDGSSQAYLSAESESYTFFPPTTKAADLASFDLTALFNNYSMIDQEATLQTDLAYNNSSSTSMPPSNPSFSSTSVAVAKTNSQLNPSPQFYYEQSQSLPKQLLGQPSSYNSSPYDSISVAQEPVLPIHPTNQQQISMIHNMGCNIEIPGLSQADPNAAYEGLRPKQSTPASNVPLAIATQAATYHCSNDSFLCKPSFSEPIPSQQHQPQPQQQQQQQQSNTCCPPTRKRARSTLQDFPTKNTNSMPLVVSALEPPFYVDYRKDSFPAYSPELSNYVYSYPQQQQQQQQVELNDQMLAAMPRRQKTRYENDYYTPKWVRYTGHLKEGYCDLCQPGKWLQLKNSAYWYHKQFYHGISSVSGQPFLKPLKHRLGKGDVIEGLCHQCHKYVSACNGKKKNSYMLWYRHAHKCHLYDKPNSTKANTSRKLSNDTLSTASSVSTIVAGGAQSHHLNKGF